MSTYTTQVVRTAAERDACFAIRHIVFVYEQNVPVEEEIDGYEDAAIHVLVRLAPGAALVVPPSASAAEHAAVHAERAVATARLLPTDAPRDNTAHAGHTYKAQRVAVLPAYRKTGLGRLVMDALEAEAARAGGTLMVLGAQRTAEGFYARLGYTAYGETFMDAGIPHVMMQKALAD